METIRAVALPVALVAVGLSLAISGISQSLSGSADFGVRLWPPILIISGAVTFGAGLSRKTGFMLFAVGLVGCLGLYARAAGDWTILLVALGLVAIVGWSSGRRAGFRLALSALGFTASLGSGALGLFLLYGAFLARGQGAQWLGGAVVFLAIAVIGLRSASRDFRRASQAAKPADTPG